VPSARTVAVRASMADGTPPDRRSGNRSRPRTALGGQARHSDGGCVDPHQVGSDDRL